MTLVFVAVALLGAVVASYTDVKKGVIQNKLTMPLFAFGFIGHLVVEGQAILAALLVSVGLIFTLGYGFWIIGGWSAGDAKEFLFLAALLPEYPPSLEGLFNPVLGNYPFMLSMFIDTFLAILPFILIWGIYTSLKQSKLNELLEPLKNFRETTEHAMVFTGAVLLAVLLDVNVALAVPLAYVSYKIKDPFRTVSVLIVAALYLFLEQNPFFIARYFIGVFLAVMVFKLLWNSIKIIRKNALLDSIPIQDLEEGMVPSKAIQTEEGKIEPRARGLTQEETGKIKRHYGLGKIAEIEIKRTIPFAPVIFIGLLISLSIGDLAMVMRHG